MFEKIRKPVATSAVIAALVAGGATAAHAAVDYVGGGTWNHGVNSSTVWSNYYHGSTCHGATSVGTYTDRENRSAGYWATTSAPSRWYAVDKAYWRTSC
ncbi:lactococcin 972 family bacteriocin [Isoptericola rhizosphaerae]|uniref:lactococcin 972 family bacteriocin n=1 Tax=Isoptericola rhizosphaerae TaxID=3377837 RepID=UPI00383AEBEC